MTKFYFMILEALCYIIDETVYAMRKVARMAGAAGKYVQKAAERMKGRLFEYAAGLSYSDMSWKAWAKRCAMRDKYRGELLTKANKQGVKVSALFGEQDEAAEELIDKANAKIVKVRNARDARIGKLGKKYDKKRAAARSKAAALRSKAYKL